MAYYQNYFSFLQPSGTPQASGLLFSAWNARKALAALVLFVGRRYYLRLISCPWTAAGYWNALWRYWTARRAHSGYSCTCVRWQRDERAMSVRCVSVGAPRELCSNGERRRCGALQSLTREETFVSEAISDDSCLI